jgi:CheY-like chemotaxis protein/HPt (histidine-containing phosphotransfer) domain-containing protein
VNQLLVTEQIRRMGAAVVVVGDGAAAVEAVRRSGRFDVVLMDWQMPGVDGVTATRQIRDMERAEGLDPICILGMSASGTTADRHTCLGAGMDDLLTKPVGLAALGAALRQHVGGSRTPSGPEPEAEPRAFGADTAALDRLVQELGTRDPVLSIVRSYLDELATRRTALEDAVARGDEAALRRTAHALRATSRTLGAESVDAVALALEQGPFPPSPALLADFATAAEHTAVDLGAWLEHNG